MTATEPAQEPSIGLAHGLLIALPIWIVIGLAGADTLANAFGREAVSLALMAGMVGTVVLARRLLHAPLSQAIAVGRARFAGMAGSGAAFRPLARQTIALSALAAAYLQYYFLDVKLQIASMQSVTYFVPMPS